MSLSWVPGESFAKNRVIERYCESDPNPSTDASPAQLKWDLRGSYAQDTEKRKAKHDLEQTFGFLPLVGSRETLFGTIAFEG